MPIANSCGMSEFDFVWPLLLLMDLASNPNVVRGLVNSNKRKLWLIESESSDSCIARH
jgi:hypothetical protein